MGERIGIGIVGCGRWGQNLVRVFNGLLGARVIVCGNKSNRGRLDQLKSIYPHIEITQNVGDILLNPLVDAIIVSTPDETHFDIGRRALAAKKHAFIEKPLALSFDQAEELVNLAKSQSKILMTGHIMQYHPAVQWIKKRLVTAQSHPVSILSTRVDFGIAKGDADILWSSVVHDVSMIQYLLGTEPEEVSVVGASFNSQKLNDVLYINMLFPSDVAGHIHAGFAGPYRERKLVLYTTQDIIVFDGLSGNLELFPRKASKSGNEGNMRDYEKQFEAAQRVALSDIKEPLVIECQHFLDCIKMNTVPLSGGDNALAVMRTLDRLDRALKSTNTGK